jgi:signal transduction histidine kinase
MHELENLISVIKDAETGQRGFIITGDWIFLEPYYNGVTAVHKSIKKLKGSNLFDDRAHQEIDAIQGYVENLFDKFHKTIVLKKSGKTEDAQHEVLIGEGENTMRNIRQLVESLKFKKADMLLKFDAISRERSNRIITTILIGNIVALLFVIFSFFQLFQDISERKRAENGLRDSQKMLRSLAERIEKIREEERVIISREIHDVMGGGLTGLKMDLFWLMQKMKKFEPDNENKNISDRTQTCIESIDKMIRITRRISTELRPPVLDDLGLAAALEWQLSDFTNRTGIQHVLNIADEYAVTGSDKTIAVFRIFQEILTNIARHSQATKVDVVLWKHERNSFGDKNLVLEIRDNGRGITEEEILNPESVGLLGMKERAISIGGEFSIAGESGIGTTALIKIPISHGDAT